MCKAEGDDIFIVNSVKGRRSILKAKCMATEIILDKFIDSKMKLIAYMCYLQGVKYVALSHWSGHIVQAVHCETGDEVWEVKGEVEGVTWKPHRASVFL